MRGVLARDGAGAGEPPDSEAPDARRGLSAAAAAWRARWRAFRNRLIGDARFRRLSARFWPTRGVARANAKAAFDLATGFVYTQTLTACVRLEILPFLAETPRWPVEVAAHARLPDASALLLLKAAASLRLAERDADGRYGLGLLGAAIAADPGVAAMVRHHALLYQDLADPVAFLRGTSGPSKLAAYWTYAAGDGRPAGDDDVAPYSELMASSQSFVAETVLDAVDLRGVRTLMDVGGGEGAFLSAAGRRHPALELVLFDLPAVASRAARRFEAAGFSGRARVAGGSFFGDPLPQGADAASLVRVLHDHDDAPAMALLRRIREALPTGGRLILAEPMAGTRGAEAMGDAYFGFYLKAMGSGRPRTAAEIRAMLAAAGFASSRERPTSMPIFVRVIEAVA